MRQSQIAVLEDAPSSPSPPQGSSKRGSLGGGTSIPLPASMRKERVSVHFVAFIIKHKFCCILVRNNFLFKVTFKAELFSYQFHNFFLIQVMTPKILICIFLPERCKM